MKKKLSVILIPISVLFLIAGWYFWDDITMIPYAPSIETHQWQTHISGSDLQIRKVRNNEMVFLIKPTKRIEESQLEITNGAYQYESASKEFKLVSQDVWDTAEGEIKTCRLNDPSPNYETYGRYPLVSATASKNGRVGVISAAGPKIPPIFSFLPGQATGRILGMRYFEVFYPQKEMAKSEAVRVGKLEDINLCWTPDDNFVVIYSSYFTTLSVVDIKTLEENKTK